MLTIGFSYKSHIQLWPGLVSTKNGLYLDHFVVSCIKENDYLFTSNCAISVSHEPR